jgi:hypothetical protein
MGKRKPIETELHRTLMIRDDITLEEAEQVINELRTRMRAGEHPEDLLYEIGLEIDYTVDLLTI